MNKRIEGTSELMQQMTENWADTRRITAIK